MYSTYFSTKYTYHLPKSLDQICISGKGKRGKREKGEKGKKGKEEREKGKRERGKGKWERGKGGNVKG